MTYTQVGSCPRCGAPVWNLSPWNAVTPPPPYYTCGCANTVPGSMVQAHTYPASVPLPPALKSAQENYMKVLTALEAKKQKAEHGSTPEGVLERVVVLEQRVADLIELVEKLSSEWSNHRWEIGEQGGKGILKG